MKSETKHSIHSAIDEIRRLRQTNEILQAQVDVIEVFKRATFGCVGRNDSLRLDIAWMLERSLKAEEDDEAMARQREDAAHQQAPDRMFKKPRVEGDPSESGCGSTAATAEAIDECLKTHFGDKMPPPTYVGPHSGDATNEANSSDF